jgi:tRNA (cmo5U34)-methyltransferase
MMPMTGNDSRGHIPGEKWEFDGAVTECFEDMLRRSIPQYDAMRAAVFSLACRYQKPKTAIVDLGASRGDALAPLLDKFGAYNSWVAVEVSPPMLEVLRQRFAGWITNGLLTVSDTDLRTGFPPVQASVILSVLTLQFTPIEYRQQIVKRAFDALVPGGAIVLVEKVLGATAELDEALVAEYYAFKRDSGYTEDEIQRKRMALEGVLVPLTAEWNETLLRRCGFGHVDCFWRAWNFAGWVAVK